MAPLPAGGGAFLLPGAFCVHGNPERENVVLENQEISVIHLHRDHNTPAPNRMLCKFVRPCDLC